MSTEAPSKNSRSAGAANPDPMTANRDVAPPRPSRAALRAQALAALDRAYKRLTRLSYYGQWQGFPTLAGLSTTWVTGFVATHLGACRTYEGRVTLSACALLAQQRPSGGWGYGNAVPPDADSTAWSVMAIRIAGLNAREALRRAEEFMLTHVGRDGVSTFRHDSGIASFIGAPPRLGVAGWTSPHPDVTVAVLLAGVPLQPSPAAERLLRQVVGLQDRRGLFPGYWWRSQFYTAALVLRLLASKRRRLADDRTARLLHALERAALPGGGYGLGPARTVDPFSTALAVEILCRLGPLRHNDLVVQAISSLLEAQAPHGGWHGSRVLRIPRPWVGSSSPTSASGDERDVDATSAEDVDGLFATVLSCYALDLFLTGSAATEIASDSSSSP